ncbi:MAG: hydroxymethylbilane synthase [Deltaproteobacteria bacterium]|nr:hydroxymethylbilane synthase [Deltaproteobacteria bacterium]
MNGTLKIGSRGSKLALTQTNWVADLIRNRHPGITVEVIIIKTKGDIMQDVSLAKIGGKGLFVKELEDALLKNDVDLAVHSMKDVPAELPAGLEIGIVPEREDPRDVLISKNNRKIEELPKRARIGTGSMRRGFQLLNYLPDIEIVPLRGNLDTRIKKVETENLDGVILAAAGIRRMGWAKQISQYLPVEMVLPAVGQGVIGIEMRSGDARVKDAVSFLHHETTWFEVSAERAFLKRIGGGCQLPIAAYGKKSGDQLLLRGLVGGMDGRVMVREEVAGPVATNEALGRELAERILSRGGKELLDEVYTSCLTTS